MDEALTELKAAGANEFCIYLKWRILLYKS